MYIVILIVLGLLSLNIFQFGVILESRLENRELLETIKRQPYPTCWDYEFYKQEELKECNANFYKTTQNEDKQNNERK